MDVLVLGAGIIGLTTAYYLNRDGYNVTVIERNNDVALETSFANGAQLSYSYVAPLAGPGVMSHVPKWLLDRNSPCVFVPAWILPPCAGTCVLSKPAMRLKVTRRRVSYSLVVSQP